jgi:RNA polymerase sigma-70 factor, ECF subfamily
MALSIRPGADDAALLAAQEAVQDALLVERVLRGDAEAYGDLVARHMRRAFSVAYRVLEHREDAEDVVQDAFIRALERIDTLDRSRPFRAWFYRIVVNQALNFRRSRTRRTMDPIPDDARTTTSSPEEDAERAGLRERLNTVMQQLSEKQRTIVQLADLEEFTSAEIAHILDMADGTVRWHLHQARKTLRQLLGPVEDRNE